MKQYNNWEEIDKDTDGLVTSLTYIVLFVNDQVYNYALNIYDSCRNTPYYRRGVKKNIKRIEKIHGIVQYKHLQDCECQC